MKKLILTALAATMAMGAYAADYKVVADGVLGAGIDANGWYNCNWNTVDGAFQFGIGAENTTGSMGLITGPTAKWATGPLWNSTLNIEWKYQGDPGAKCTLRVTANNANENGTNIEQDYVLFASAEAGDYVTTSINVAEAFPAVSAAWKDGKGTGFGFVLGMVFDNANTTSKLDLKNVYYSNIDETWQAPAEVIWPAPTTVPAPNAAQADVISLVSIYPAAGTFGFPNWGQSTLATNMEIDGSPVIKLENFNYQGLDGFNLNVSECNYMHVDYWTPNGVAFGFTPISPGAEKSYVAPVVEKETWNSYDVKLSFWDNVNMSDIFQVKFVQGNGTTIGYVANLYFYKKEEVPPTPGSGEVYEGSVISVATQTNPDTQETKEYPFTINYSIVYNEDNTLTINYNYVWSDGAPIGIVNGNVYVDNTELAPVNSEDGRLTATTTTTYAKGDKLAIRFFAPFAWNVLNETVAYTVGDVLSSVAVEGVEAADAPAEYYTIQGIRVANPERGLYIRVQNGKATKVIL
ncbi:MAG: hypothetical protein K2M41_04035 [Muribaculaceae bacterium]|nr:hypothetical protein [Muribaculaceae bacterium]